MISKKRFYIVTGKGGVGKTLASFALTKRLINEGHNAKYLTFSSGKIENKKSDSSPHFGLPHIELNLLDCATEYVGRKMKSETVAKWVVKTPFFRALINMLPGFSYLIYLGKTVDLLQKDPSLTLILDSPSSGHALTMFESTVNYQEIFQSGLLFDDTNKVINQLYAEGFTKAAIISLPTMMALNESVELKAEINKIQNIETTIACNNIMSSIESLSIEKLPQLLQDKIMNEKDVLSQFQEHISSSITYFPEEDVTQIIDLMSKEVGEII